MRVSETDTTDSFKVAGRGEMHLSILIENMRREGYELAVSTPRVLYKEIEGKLCEPIEELVVDVPENCVGSVMEKMGTRKAEMVSMNPMGSSAFAFKEYRTGKELRLFRFCLFTTYPLR